MRNSGATRSRRRAVPCGGAPAEAIEPRMLLSGLVTNLNDSGPGSLRAAIAQVDPSDSYVVFAPGLTGTLVLTSGPLEIQNSFVQIYGPGPGALTISGNNSSRVFQVDASGGLYMQGLTISDGATGDAGAGIKNVGSLGLSNVVVSDNIAQQGDGGGIFNSGTLTIEGSTISANSSIFALGGGIYNSGTVHIQTPTVISGDSATQGGGIYNDVGAVVRAAHAAFSGNWSINFNYGGAVFNNAGTVSIVTCTFSGDSAGRGAGIYSYGGSTTVTGSGFANESGGGYGGGIYEERGTLTVLNSSFSADTADFGPGIANLAGTASITGSSFDRGSADFQAGAVYNDAGTLIATNCSFTNNSSSALYDGGAVFSDTQFTGNLAIADSTFAGNHSGKGGAIAGLGKATLTNDTIVGNSAVSGAGGIFFSSGPIVLNNTIVVGNTVGGQTSVDISGTVSGSNDLVGSGGSGGLVDGVNGNVIGADPKLGVPGNYGGPTETIPLLPGSPALDAGSNALAVDGKGSPLGTDNRGLPRIFNGTVDIGAYEAQPPALAGDVNHDGKVDFSDLLILAQHYGSTTEPLWENGDVTEDGSVAFADLLVLAQNYGQPAPSAAAASALDELKTGGARLQLRHRIPQTPTR